MRLLCISSLHPFLLPSWWWTWQLPLSPGMQHQSWREWGGAWLGSVMCEKPTCCVCAGVFVYPWPVYVCLCLSVQVGVCVCLYVFLYVCVSLCPSERCASHTCLCMFACVRACVIIRGKEVDKFFWLLTGIRGKFCTLCEWGTYYAKVSCLCPSISPFSIDNHLPWWMVCCL